MQLSTPNADIAYHLKFKDDEIGRELQEGDVVGFFTDEDGGTYVKLLQSGDAHKAIHAGVISRSWYLAANRMAEQGGFDQSCPVQALKRISLSHEWAQICYELNQPRSRIFGCQLHLLSTTKLKNPRNITIGCWLKSFTKTFNGDFQSCLPTGKVENEYLEDETSY